MWRGLIEQQPDLTLDEVICAMRKQRPRADEARVGAEAQHPRDQAAGVGVARHEDDVALLVRPQTLGLLALELGGIQNLAVKGPKWLGSACQAIRSEIRISRVFAASSPSCQSARFAYARGWKSAGRWKSCSALVA